MNSESAANSKEASDNDVEYAISSVTCSMIQLEQVDRLLAKYSCAKDDHVQKAIFAITAETRQVKRYG